MPEGFKITKKDDTSSVGTQDSGLAPAIAVGEKQEEESLLNELKKVQKENLLLKKELLEQEKRIQNLTKLVSVINHDFRSPLQGILGLSEILMDSTDMDEEKIKEDITSINQTAENILNLSNEFSLWSKDQLGKGGEVKNQTINLYSKIQSIIKLFEIKIKEKQITLSNNIDKMQTVFADNNRLSLALRNIISNAVKFTYNGGNISISFKNNEIIISDDGKGISEKRLNDFFNQIGTTDYGIDHEKGVGVGMNLCKSYVEEMGGKISVESKGEGRGSTFIITLPEGNKESSN